METTHGEQPSGIRLTIAITVVCFAMYLLAATLSSIVAGGDFSRFGRYFDNPAGNIQDDLGSGGLVPFLQGDLWSLIASSYLHKDLAHLFGNMAVLVILFPIIARGFGAMRAFGLFTLAGIGGSAASIFSQEYFSLGASSGVSGLFGAMIVLGLRERGPGGWSKVAIGVFLAAVTTYAWDPVGSTRISYSAHAGGLATGLIAATLMHSGVSVARINYIYRASVAFTVLSLAFGIGNGLWWTWQARNNPPAYTAHLAARRTIVAREILARNPVTAYDFLLRGGVYQDRDNPAAALADYTRSIELEKTPDAYSARAELQFYEERYNEAIDDFSAALVLDPNDIATYRQRGSSYTQAKDYENAIADFSYVISVDPDDARALNNRAWALYLSGQAGEGLADVEKSLRLEPDNAAVLDTRGHIFEALGERDKAIADYRAVLAKDPNVVESREGLKRLGLEP